MKTRHSIAVMTAVITVMSVLVVRDGEVDNEDTMSSYKDDHYKVDDIARSEVGQLCRRR
jgi:hypothetical protein